ncbi:hypothetical protein HOLleu_40551 [Holothuria leucospilota]|uniref:Uncharacterized protein n=1 Tax=Holothuria leucospilota TaxID=206669 RepID=A0A9Q0YG90_HOLLE|nr:hypothetical protein HOLleu_40551 [Holothuria leucospilota]
MNLTLNADMSYMFGIPDGGKRQHENHSKDFFIISGSEEEAKRVLVRYCKRKCFDTCDGHYHCPIRSFDLFEYFLVEGVRPNIVDTCTWTGKTVLQEHLFKDHGAEKMDDMVTVARFTGKKSFPKDILAACPENYVKLIDEMKERPKKRQRKIKRHYKNKKKRLRGTASSDDKENFPS